MMIERTGREREGKKVLLAEKEMVTEQWPNRSLTVRRRVKLLVTEGREKCATALFHLMEQRWNMRFNSVVSRYSGNYHTFIDPRTLWKNCHIFH